MTIKEMFELLEKSNEFIMFVEHSPRRQADLCVALTAFEYYYTDNFETFVWLLEDNRGKKFANELLSIDFNQNGQEIECGGETFFVEFSFK